MLLIPCNEIIFFEPGVNHRMRLHESWRGERRFSYGDVVDSFAIRTHQLAAVESMAVL